MKRLEGHVPHPAGQEKPFSAKLRNYFFSARDVPSSMTLPAHHPAARTTLPPSPASLALPFSIALLQMPCAGNPIISERI